MSRPHTVTKDKIDRIVAAIKDVLILNRACDLAGLSRRTVYDWLRRAEEHDKTYTDSHYTEFAAGVKKAQAEKIRELVENIHSRVANWQANAWLLERCFREDFGTDAGVIVELLARADRMELQINDLMNGKGLLNDKTNSSETKEIT